MTDNPFDKPTGLPSISFATRDEAGNLGTVPVGTRLGGKVTKAPEIVQSRVYEGSDKGKPQFWDNKGKGVKTVNAKDSEGMENKPVQQIVINLMTPQGEEKSLWVPFYPKAMYEAIQAVLAGRAIEVGDELFVTLTGFTPIPGKNPAKDYGADFTKGMGVFAPPPPAAAPAPPPPAPPAPPAAPAPPPPAAGPATTPEGFTLEGLLRGGWTHDQAIAAYPMLNGHGAIPAQPSAEDARAKKLAEMSAEDRELLGL